MTATEFTAFAYGCNKVQPTKVCSAPTLDAIERSLAAICRAESYSDILNKDAILRHNDEETSEDTCLENGPHIDYAMAETEGVTEGRTIILTELAWNYIHQTFGINRSCQEEWFITIIESRGPINEDLALEYIAGCVL